MTEHIDNRTIITAVLSRETVDIPTLQSEFSLSYSKARSVIDRLVLDGALVYDSGITYTVSPQKRIVSADKPTNDDGGDYDETDLKMFVSALLGCIHHDCVSVPYLRRREGFSEFTARRAIRWMKEVGAVEEFGDGLKVVMTGDEFYAKFGSISFLARQFGGMCDERNDEQADGECGSSADDEYDKTRKMLSDAIKLRTTADVGKPLKEDVLGALSRCMRECDEAPNDNCVFEIGGAMYEFCAQRKDGTIAVTDGGALFGECGMTEEEARTVRGIDETAVIVDGKLTLTVSGIDAAVGCLFKLYAIVRAIENLRKTV